MLVWVIEEGLDDLRRARYDCGSILLWVIEESEVLILKRGVSCRFMLVFGYFGWGERGVGLRMWRGTEVVGGGKIWEVRGGRFGMVKGRERYWWVKFAFVCWWFSFSFWGDFFCTFLFLLGVHLDQSLQAGCLLFFYEILDWDRSNGCWGLATDGF